MNTIAYELNPQLALGFIHENPPCLVLREDSGIEFDQVELHCGEPSDEESVYEVFIRDCHSANPSRNTARLLARFLIPKDGPAIREVFMRRLFGVLVLQLQTTSRMAPEENLISGTIEI